MRAALKPDLSGIESLWREPKTATDPQKLLSEFTVNDLLIGNVINSVIDLLLLYEFFLD